MAKKVSLKSDIPGSRTKVFKEADLTCEPNNLVDQLADWINDVGRAYGCRKSVWCNYSVRDFSKVAFKGKFTIKYDLCWGEPQQATVTNPTYLKLWQIADRLIRLSGDSHHVFVESFVRRGNVITLWTGS